MGNSWPTADTLSRWLRSSGTLPRGEVSHVQLGLDHKTDYSQLFFLTASYSPDAPNNLPRHLVVKSSLETTAVRHTELQFYQEVAAVIGMPPVVRCLAAIKGDDNNSEVIVLEDLRSTHDNPPWPNPPSPEHSAMAIDALARVHTQFWEAPTLGDTLGQSHTTASLTTMVKAIAAHLPAFVDSIGEALPTDGRRIYESVFGSSLKPWLRLTDRNALTINHGDAHTWNFLFPRSSLGVAFLIDWQGWHIDVGARDLAFFMALHWNPTLRRELEMPLLRRYHEAVVNHGIDNYLFEDLLLDYRRCVVRNLTIPILFWSRGMKSEGWKGRLDCAIAAYNDLECGELL